MSAVWWEDTRDPGYARDGAAGRAERPTWDEVAPTWPLGRPVPLGPDDDPWSARPDSGPTGQATAAP